MNNKNLEKFNFSFKTSIEVVLVYFVAVIAYLTTFESINTFLYGFLGYTSLLMFLTIVGFMIWYITNNIKELFKEIRN